MDKLGGAGGGGGGGREQNNMMNVKSTQPSDKIVSDELRNTSLRTLRSKFKPLMR